MPTNRNREIPVQDTTDLPEGIYFERSRKRFRVRLYKFGRVVYQTYHHSRVDAIRSLNRGKRRRNTLLDDHTTHAFGDTLDSMLEGLFNSTPELNST